MANTNLYLSLVSAAGMILVAVAALSIWRQKANCSYRWFLLGAVLWSLMVPVKYGIAEQTNSVVYAWLHAHLPQSMFLPMAGLYGGLLSSGTEIGLTLIAVLLWRRLGRDAGQAIGIGIGAGACEAIYFGMIDASLVLAALAGMSAIEPTREKIDARAEATPLFWLVDPVERVIVVLCHASSRALVLLGVAQRRPRMVCLGFAIFTLLDGIATAATVHGGLTTGFIWWVQLAFLPLAVVSIFILRSCWTQFGHVQDARLLEPQMVIAS